MKSNITFVLLLLFAVSCTAKNSGDMKNEKKTTLKQKKKDSLRDKGEMKFDGRVYRNEIPPVKDKIDNLNEVK